MINPKGSSYDLLGCRLPETKATPTPRWMYKSEKTLQALVKKQKQVETAQLLETTMLRLSGNKLGSRIHVASIAEALSLTQHDVRAKLQALSRRTSGPVFRACGAGWWVVLPRSR